MGQILLAGEEPHEWPSLLGHVVANRPTKHRVASLERGEDAALRDLALDVERHLGADLCECSQMMWENDSNHGSV
jgi:hypothetical protein